MTSDSLSTDNATESQRPWMAAALIAHTSWGLYPVLARYLQTISDLPSMTLLAFGNILPLLVVLVLFGRKLDRRVFTSRILWVFALIVVARAVTNMLAARYTLSIYVQLVTQSTPFLVVVLGAGLFKERIPKYTGTAIFLCLTGALLMIGGDIGQAATADPGRSDWLGIGLALTSSLCLAFYMLVVRRTADVRHNVPAEAVLVVQLITIILVTTGISLLTGEDWGRWLEIGRTDWLMFAGLSFGVFVVANLGQVGALRHLGAPLVSSIMAWRLVSALVMGWWVLGERLDSWGQLLGAAVVLITVTWYLWRQREPAASI